MPNCNAWRVKGLGFELGLQSDDISSFGEMVAKFELVICEFYK